MSTLANHPVPVQRHQGPHLGALAIAFTVLFCAGLYPVTWFGGRPFFPGPWAPASEIAAFFQQRPSAALLCAFLQFGSAIPLGIFTATAVSRLEFFGVRAAGTRIALFGGFATAFMMMTGAAVLWSMVHPVVAQDVPLTTALYYLGFLIGGPGYSVSFGLLMAGLSVPLFFRRVVPRWIPILGLVLALCGELSWLSIELPKALFLVPLTRFPGFVWIIAVGFALPSTVKRTRETKA
ncbi:MAG: hypothetical protein WAL75_02095 [Terracidiphilus sp.]